MNTGIAAESMPCVGGAIMLGSMVQVGHGKGMRRGVCCIHQGGVVPRDKTKFYTAPFDINGNDYSVCQHECGLTCQKPPLKF